MVSFKIRGSPISLAYGYDFFPGVFLSVFDCRLEYDPNATDAVNAVTESIGVRDGGGSYFDLHTGTIGFGLKVDHATMATYLRRFGVPEDQIRSLPLNLVPASPLAAAAAAADDDDAILCPVCIGNVASKACSICHDVKYCSKQCQVKDWSFHKLFCNLAFSSQPSSVPKDSVVALLLPSDSKKPIKVRIPHEWICLDDDDDDCDEWFWHINMDEFIQNASTVRSAFFPHEKQKKLTHSFHVAFKEDFLIDGISKHNECIQHIFKQKKCAVDSRWRGTVLLIKSEKGEYNPKYEDLSTYNDIMDAVDFLIDYSVATYDA